ncbi:mannan endo-1,4-beta-mannosidase [Reichenbachiella agariperforans]|uniref:Mannan endo-1,4-beta-mannosidase n=1 Tax=Reichenbachiella agariperforans TaxID=156994 RepID=A0A1M6PZL0_REIAG|nr:glycosyl hydrolase [Reichenbachiella agariperforans]SHK13341.1 mannan endo-1,4-beta-mannosidase [Reichenbachiella agariperforans]
MKQMFRTSALIVILFASWVARGQDPVASVEAEEGVLNGVQSSSSTSGYSGEGYVTGFDNGNDYVEVQINISQGDLYRLEIGYSSSAGSRTQKIFINDEGAHPIHFEGTNSGEWLVQRSGTYRFNSGSNKLKLQSDWGYIDIDNFTLYEVEEKSYDVTTTLIDPEANEDAGLLYDFMLEHFGKRVISGQTNDTYEDLADEAGYRPLMRTFDFQSYTEGYTYAWDNQAGGHTFGAVDDGQVSTAITWYEATGGQGIVNWQWHWHSPSGGEAGTNSFYTDQTDFDVREAVKKGTAEYELVIRDIDAIAVQLQKLSNAGVPIIWRPLHEAGGGWFWWGAKGAEPCLQLWDIVYDRLQNHHGIHNLVWSWSTPEEDWYPGNEKVDFIGYDSYPGAENYVPQTQMYDQVYEITKGKKIIAMTENGPIPDFKTSFGEGAPWSMFMSWSNLVFEQNSNGHIQQVYGYWRVLVFDDDYNLIIREEEDETIEPEEPVLDVKLGSGGMRLYPNPAHDQVQVLGGTFVDLTVYDMTGRSVGQWPQQSDTVDVSGLSDGYYMMVFQNGQTTERLQLIIRR